MDAGSTDPSEIPVHCRGQLALSAEPTRAEAEPPSRRETFSNVLAAISSGANGNVRDESGDDKSDPDDGKVLSAAAASVAGPLLAAVAAGADASAPAAQHASGDTAADSGLPLCGILKAVSACSASPEVSPQGTVNAEGEAAGQATVGSIRDGKAAAPGVSDGQPGSPQASLPGPSGVVEGALPAPPSQTDEKGKNAFAGSSTGTREADTRRGPAAADDMKEIKLAHRSDLSTQHSPGKLVEDAGQTLQTKKSEENGLKVPAIHDRPSGAAAAEAKPQVNSADGSPDGHDAAGARDPGMAPASGGNAASLQYGFGSGHDGRGDDASKSAATPAIHSGTEPQQGAPNPAAVLTVPEKVGRADTVSQGGGTLQAGDRTITIADQTFRISRKDDRSVEVSLEPDGLGKIEITLGLDKGTVHATIHAVENSAREILERNLTNIVATLTREGIAVGGFSVALKGNRDGSTSEGQDSGRGKRDRENRVVSPSVGGTTAAGGTGLINLFA